MTTMMKRAMGGMLFATTMLAALPGSAATIVLNDVGGVTGSAAERGFRVAADYWAATLRNDVRINFDVGFSSLGAGILGGTRSNLFTDVPIADYRALLSGAATSKLDAQAVSGFAPLTSTGSVVVTIPDYFDAATKTGVGASGSRIAPDGTPIANTIAISSANVKALVGGFEDVTDADIQFSSDFAFDFDPTDGITPGQYDFIGVAVHEMGHALGFLSGVEDLDYSVGAGPSIDDYWWGYAADMFRYSAPGKLDWTFGTDSYFSLDGGATAFQGGEWSTGSDYGDGWQASHWKSPGGCTDFLGIMNPYICNGQGDDVTALDLGLLDAIGWDVGVDVVANPGYKVSTAQIAAVPEPATWGMMILGFGVIGTALRRRPKVRATVRYV